MEARERSAYLAGAGSSSPARAAASGAKFLIQLHAWARSSSEPPASSYLPLIVLVSFAPPHEAMSWRVWYWILSIVSVSPFRCCSCKRIVLTNGVKRVPR